MKLRGALVEHPFGTLKRWAGMDHFLMRGPGKIPRRIQSDDAQLQLQARAEHRRHQSIDALLRLGSKNGTKRRKKLKLHWFWRDIGLKCPHFNSCASSS